MSQPDPSELMDTTNFEAINAQIESLIKVSSETGEYSSVLEHIMKFTTGLCASCFRGRIDKIFRGRVGRFDRADDLWYPPSGLVRAYGRLNKPGDPVFYGCLNLLAVFLELLPENGEYVTVITCEPKDDRRFFRFGHIGFHSTMIEENPGTPLRAKLREHLIKLESGLPSDLERSKNRRIAEFLDTEFRKKVVRGNEHEYLVSAAIAELFFKLGEYPEYQSEFLGLIYPSIATEEQAENIAIKPSVIDENFVPTQASRFQISRRGRHINAHEVSQGTLEPDGYIVW